MISCFRISFTEFYFNVLVLFWFKFWSTKTETDSSRTRIRTSSHPGPPFRFLSNSPEELGQDPHDEGQTHQSLEPSQNPQHVFLIPWTPSQLSLEHLKNTFQNSRNPLKNPETRLRAPWTASPVPLNMARTSLEKPWNLYWTSWNFLHTTLNLL